MKKFSIVIFVITIFTVSLYAYGTLTGSQTQGLNKICFYSDGSAITVGSASLCPLSK